MPDNTPFNETDLPYSLEAEQAVLGSILMEAASIHQVADILQPDYFYLPEHRAVYRAMTFQMLENKTIDFVTVLEALKAEPFFADENGKAYLLKMAQMVPSISHITHYAEIIKEKYAVRTLIQTAREIMEDALDPANEAEALLDAAEQKIYNIRQQRKEGGLVHIQDVLASNYEMYTKLVSEDRDQYLGIPTGLSALDAITTGLNRSDLVIVGSRPGMGKTSFALNVARNIAARGHTVAVFNLEMSREQMVNRFLSAEARVSGKNLRTGMLTPEEWSRIAAASGVLCRLPIYLDDSSNITVPEIKARLRRQSDVSVAVIDYLGLMKAPIKTENRVQEVSEITRSLKIMAKELHIPLLVCAQLSRGVEKGATHRPALADLRESGSIEQDADQVLFLYREDYYHDDDEIPEENNIAEIIVSKNRHGELGTAKVSWLGEFTMFSTLETHYHD
ncbi:MAG: replicative DNA helicase [Oscillospiraceae bacterium]|nr:replicative DNA helicase [Oscillospiraceae bacterium]